MSQRYNDNVKRPKLKENHLGILKIYAFSRKILLRTLDPGEHCCSYVSMRIQPKSCCIFPSKVAATLLSGSGKGAVGA